MSRQQVSPLQKAVHAIGRHSEFVGCATVAVLIGLAFVQTDWMPYAREPHEIMDRLAAARSALDDVVWPETERNGFLNIESTNAARVVESRLYAKISRDLYTGGRIVCPAALPLTLQELELEPVRHLVATPGRVLIELRPAGAMTPTTATPEVESRETEPWPDELRTRGATRDRQDPATAMPWYDVVMSTDDEPLAEGPVAREGHGYPFVAVRGLFDASTQVSAIAMAVHRHPGDAEKLLELIDFYLERQTFDRKRNAWSSWEPVDVQVFRDLARMANGFERDVVPSSATDAVITGPLLMRITGRWETLATHPLLQGGQLSPGELEREAAFHRALLELQSEARSPRRAVQTPQRGFTDLLLDARRLEEDLFDPVMSAAANRPPQRSFGFAAATANADRYNRAVEDLVRRIGERMDPKQTDRELPDWIRARMTQGASRQILFRYFDFNVEPGAAYRYQVRLELRNPNFGRSLSAAGGAPHVVEGETRLTPWSEPTHPVRVRRNVHYFLAGLEDSRQRQFPSARMKVFQYDTNLGTLVQQELRLELGQQIGGTAKALLLDPAAGVRTEGDYDFRSRDTLLDALPDLAFDRDLHPDLQLPAGSVGAAHISEYALVLADDELRTIDPRSQADELARQERYIDLQSQQLQHLKSDAERFDGWEDEYERMMYEELFGRPAAAEDQRPQPRRRNMLQRGQ